MPKSKGKSYKKKKKGYKRYKRSFGGLKKANRKAAKASRALSTQGMGAAAVFTNTGRSLAPFPTVHYTNMRYVDFAVLPSAATAGELSSYIFTINNLYDPNLTGIGHQPYGYDEISIRYNRYTVHEVTATVTFGCDVSSTMTAMSVFGLWLSANNAEPSTGAASQTVALCEYPNAVWCMTQDATGGAGGYTLTIKWKLSDWTKGEPMENFSSLITAGPSIPVYLQVLGGNQATGFSGAPFGVVLDMKVKFFDPKEILTS